MKVRVSEAAPVQLNWLVAQAEGNVRLQYDSREGLIINNVLGWIPYRPSVAWQQGGPIIEREGITIWAFDDVTWRAQLDTATDPLEATTPLIAAMRCYVTFKLGDEVDVPEILCRNTTP